ncbi:MAG: thioredoxin [Flammeovirgaceae bacterium]
MANAKQKFLELIKESEKPVLVDFYADWCRFCKQLSPELQKVADLKRGEVVCIKVNVETNPTVSDQFKVKGLPTLLLFQKGQVLWRNSGAISASELEKVLDQHVTVASEN